MTSNDNLQERLANHNNIIIKSIFVIKRNLEYQDFKQNIASNNTTINNEF